MSYSRYCKLSILLFFRRLATTHFEPTYARRAFPCFDEPELKAKFLVTIIHSEDMKVFFNMPLNVQTPVKGTDDQVNVDAHKDYRGDWICDN